jgi:hypothetical protein
MLPNILCSRICKYIILWLVNGWIILVITSDMQLQRCIHATWSFLWLVAFCHLSKVITRFVLQPYSWTSGKMTFTLSKWGLGSPLGLSKLQNSIARIKTPCIEVFFISLESYRSVDRNWAHMSHLDNCNTSYDKKKGRESDWQFDSRPQKVKNRLDPGVCRQSVTHHWKALDESYKFALNLIPMGGLSKEL